MRPLRLVPLICALLASQALGAVSIESAWLREPAPGQANAAIYLRLANPGPDAVVLEGATVEGAASAAVHQHTMVDGMMRMGEAPPLRVEPGAELLLKPGGYHLMVFGLGQRPAAGATLPFCLLFEGGATSCAGAVVKGIGQ